MAFHKKRSWLEMTTWARLQANINVKDLRSAIKNWRWTTSYGIPKEASVRKISLSDLHIRHEMLQKHIIDEKLNHRVVRKTLVEAEGQQETSVQRSIKKCDFHVSEW